MNSSTILLGRAAARRKEIAIRLSLGATPGRIAREVLSETLAIALLSGVAGALCAVWSAAAIRGVLAEQAPELAKAFSIRIETPAFCAGISLAAGLLAGCAPALQALAPTAIDALKESHSALGIRRGSILRKILIAFQFSAAMLLVAGAVLCIRTFLSLSNVRLGFDPSNVARIAVLMPDSRPRIETVLAAADDAIGRLSSLPGVVSAAAADGLPLDGSGRYLSVRTPGGYVMASYRLIRGDHFQTLRIPLLAGRTFHSSESRTVIVSESMAKLLWGGPYKLGSQLSLEGEKAPREVIGVAADVRDAELDKSPWPQLYLPYSGPYRETTTAPATLNLIVRCQPECAPLLPALRRQFIEAGGPQVAFRIDAAD